MSLESETFCSDEFLEILNEDQLILYNKRSDSFSHLIEEQIKFNINKELKTSCFESIIKLINSNCQHVLNNRCIKYSDLLLSDKIKYNIHTNSLIIPEIGFYLLMYKIHQKEEFIQLGIYVNKKLVDIGIKCSDDYKNIYDMSLIKVEKENLIRHQTNIGHTANIQIVNNSSKSINIDEISVVCIKVIIE